TGATSPRNSNCVPTGSEASAANNNGGSAVENRMCNIRWVPDGGVDSPRKTSVSKSYPGILVAPPGGHDCQSCCLPCAACDEIARVDGSLDPRFITPCVSS